MNNNRNDRVDSPTSDSTARNLNVANAIGTYRLFTVTNLLIAVNIVMFIVKLILTNMQNPYAPDILVDVNMGAKVNYLIADGEFWRYVSCMFLHVDVMHIGFNIIALFGIGNQIELLIGKSRFIAVYFISGLCSSAFSFMFNDKIAIGASGAIFGLLGVHIFLYALNPDRYKLVFNNFVFTVILINIGYGFIVPGIDNLAHIGGLLGGIFVSFSFTNLKIKPRFAIFKYTLPALSIIIIATSLTLGVSSYKATEDYYFTKGIFSVLRDKEDIGVNALLEGRQKFNSKRINDLLSEMKIQ